MVYDASGSTPVFKIVGGEHDGETATHVAADEALPYHAMFAVYQPKLQVRITGNTDTKPYNGSEQSVTGYTVEYKVGNGEWTNTAPTGVSVALASGKAAEAKGTNVKTDPGYLMEQETIYSMLKLI